MSFFVSGWEWNGMRGMGVWEALAVKQSHGLAYLMLQFVWDPGCQPGGGLNLTKIWSKQEATLTDREAERPCTGHTQQVGNLNKHAATRLSDTQREHVCSIVNPIHRSSSCRSC
jgi:hypothetical protein